MREEGTKAKKEEYAKRISHSFHLRQGGEAEFLLRADSTIYKPIAFLGEAQVGGGREGGGKPLEEPSYHSSAMPTFVLHFRWKFEGVLQRF